MHQQIRRWVALLQHYVDRLWYGPLIGLLAALDNFLVVIPNDGILISSSMLVPKRWFTFAFCVAIGSAVGGTLLAAFVEYYGLAMVLHYYPGIDQSESWAMTQKFFEQYGLLVVFTVAITPLIQQPAVILAGLANTPLFKVALVIFFGRWIKFMVMAYVGSHAPRLLSRLWGLESELKDAGVELNKSP
jgi:membrane protein YqaA with SNARE-associated domain